MMPLQLWETTMDPEQRLLKKLTVEDAAEANIVFSSLMGARVMCTIAVILCEFFSCKKFYKINLIQNNVLHLFEHILSLVLET